MSSKQVDQWRKMFPILSRCIYLINNSLGAMPEATYGELTAFADLWSKRGVEAWKECWWDLPGKIGDLIGDLIGGARGTVSIQPNVTSSQWVALSSLPRNGRNRIVYSALNFPSVRYFYQAQNDLEVEVVPCPDGRSVPLRSMLSAIDDRTLAVPISHVIYKSSFIQDVEEIVKKAHSVGAYVILDTYHSAGIIPLDVGRLNVDFAVGGVLKWLCGGPGVAFLYVRPDLLKELAPRLTGWLAHRDPFSFSSTLDLTDDAYRFMSGTPNIPGLFSARKGLEIISQVGIERIRTRSLELTGYILERASDLKISVRSEVRRECRGGHVTLSPPDAERLSKELLLRDFLIDFRPDAGVRVAPHFFNTLEEIDALFDEIESILKQ